MASATPNLKKLLSIKPEERLAADELLHAQVHLWNCVLSFLKSMLLKAAIELGIPDAVHNHVGGPITLPELIEAISVPASKVGSVRRIMRLLANSGIFAAVRADGAEEDSYALTPSSRLLLTKERASVAPFIRMLLDPIMADPAHLFGRAIKDGEPSPFFVLQKNTIWGVADVDARFNDLFNEGMASDSRLVVEVIRRNVSEMFDGVKTLVDVGGGTGTMAMAIAEAFPHVKCTVYDLPHVVDTVPKNSLVDFVGGDMFDHVPPADAIVLKWILHDWNDEECIKILKRCKEALPSKGGKVIIIDMVVGVSIEDEEALETQYLFDLEMLLLLTGKEREEREWQKLFAGAGFSEYKMTPSLGLRSVIELYA